MRGWLRKVCFDSSPSGPDCSSCLTSTIKALLVSSANVPQLQTSLILVCALSQWTDFSDRTLARCPHCRKVSSIGRRYPRRRSLLCFMLFVVIAASTAGLMVGTWASARSSRGIYASWVFLMVLASLTLARSLYWRCLKISEPISNVT
uniref:Phosphatidylinositol-4,5-bisphosphate 4-phosphatase n=1 Tax=Knipowitschia caucasica TaxID=637954 RepID=A0AAV2KIC1_KNICA